MTNEVNLGLGRFLPRHLTDIALRCCVTSQPPGSLVPTAMISSLAFHFHSVRSPLLCIMPLCVSDLGHCHFFSTKMDFLRRGQRGASSQLALVCFFHFGGMGREGNSCPLLMSFSVWMKVLADQGWIVIQTNWVHSWTWFGKIKYIKEMSPGMAPFLVSWTLLRLLICGASPGSSPLCPRGLFWFCTAVGVCCFVCTTLWTRKCQSKIHTLGISRWSSS